jgi:hypothetical protein
LSGLVLEHAVADECGSIEGQLLLAMEGHVVPVWDEAGLHVSGHHLCDVTWRCENILYVHAGLFIHTNIMKRLAAPTPDSSQPPTKQHWHAIMELDDLPDEMLSHVLSYM